MRGNALIVTAFVAALVASGCASRPGAEAPTSPTTGADAAGGGASANGASLAQTAGDRVFFDYDQSSLNEAAREGLRRQAQWLQRNPRASVLIAGNCDERGTREYNLALGARRAGAARDYLISLGIEANRISVTSYGKDRPMDSRPNPEGWAVNRNAHTSVVSNAGA